MTAARVRLFVIVAAVAAAVCVRLGFWQLQRLEQRKVRNALVAARIDAVPIDATALPRDTAEARYRRVRVAGTIDYDHELIHAMRTRGATLGVNILTPVRLPGSDTAILVNRGWVSSPDGSTLDLTKWRDRDSVFVGYAVELPPTGGATYANKPNVIARLSHDVVARALPYPVAPTYVVALESGDTSNASGHVARLTVPPLDNGPHMGYAVQWFGFAAVALIGAGVIVRQSRREETPDDRNVSSGGASGPG